MPIKANFIFEVSIRIPEAFTLDSIVRSPRTFKPKDVLSACDNNQLVVKEGLPPPEVTSLATYVMTDFFSMAHSTGLYNRQRKMWEALSQVNTIAVHQLSSGLINKSGLPVFDFSFQDYKGKPLLLALLVTHLPEKFKAVATLKSFIRRAAGKSTLHGALACFPAPLADDLLNFVERQTFTSDPIARYESILPSLRLPFDLLEAHETVEPGTSASNQYLLKHPSLKKSVLANPPCKAMRMVMPASRQQDEQLSDSQSAS